MNSSMKFLQARGLFSANAAFRATGSLFCLIAPLVFGSDLSAESTFKAQANPKNTHKKSKKRLQLPRNPITLTMAPDNIYAYVSYEGANTIYKVDPSTFISYESIELQKTPSKYVVDAACSALYVIYDHSSEITVIDLATGKPNYSFLLNPNPKSIAVSNDGNTIHVMQEYCDYLLSIDTKSGQVAKSPMNEDELFHSITHKIKDIQLSPDEQIAYISYENSDELSSIELAPLVVKPPKEPEYPFLSAIFDPLEEIIDFFTVDLTPAKQQIEEPSLSSESSESSAIVLIPETFASEFNGEEEVQEGIEEEPKVPEEIIAVCNLPIIDPPFETVEEVEPKEIEPKEIEQAPTIIQLPPKHIQTPVVVEEVATIIQLPPKHIKAPVLVDPVPTIDQLPPKQIETAVVDIKQQPLQTTAPVVNTPATKPFTKDLPQPRAKAPKVAYLETAKGPTTGGTAVKITGSGFTKATAVKFGGKDATQFTVHSETLLTAIAPSGAGTVDVTVTTASATSTPSIASKFTYEKYPIVLKISPESGPAKGGKTVQIRGYHFDNVTDVKFGDTSAESFKVVSSTMIKAVAPKGSDSVDVTVVTATGSSAVNSPKYTYEKKSKTKKIQKKKKK